MTDRIPLSDLTSDQLDALYDRITELEAGPETFEDGGVNDIRELYAAQDAIIASGGQLSRSVHRAIDAIRARWDAALRREQQRAEEAEADLDRVQQAACRTAEALRLNSRRLDAVLADRERERAARTTEEKRARTAEATLREILSRFTEHGHPGSPCLRTPWLNVETVSRWRAVLDQTQPSEDRQPAYDAVFAYIRSQPVDFLPATVVERNAMIWRAVHAALDQPQQANTSAADDILNQRAHDWATEQPRPEAHCGNLHDHNPHVYMKKRNLHDCPGSEQQPNV